MAAPITSDQQADLASYKDLIMYQVAILDKEATIDSGVRKLSDTNITKINDVIGKALDNIKDILVLADPTPSI